MSENSDPLSILNDGFYNIGDDINKNYLPDYSYCGYLKGGVTLPEADVVITLSPSGGDDTPIIQDAIDRVSGMEIGRDGLKGAILLKKGRYTLNRSLYIRSNGVVLRGEGQGPDGTILYNAQKVKSNTINLEGQYSLNEVTGSRTPITSPYSAVGSRTVEVEDPSAYMIGDNIAIVKTPNSNWLKTLGMDQWGWTTSGYQITQERTVTAVEGNSITFDIPLVDTIEERFGGGYLYKTDRYMTVNHCGVEKIRFESYYDGDEDENHGWVAVNLFGVENSWVKNITAVNYGYSTVNMQKDCFFNTVQDSAFLDGKSKITGGRRYSFAIQKGTGNLIQRCYSDEGRHDWVTGSRVAGPNTFLDCYSEDSHNDSGPHHRWATGILYDNIKTTELHVENRQSSGSGHGWSGAQIIFWNCEADEVICDAPVGSMNFSIGTAAFFRKGQWTDKEADGYIVSKYDHVPLRSLYIEQLTKRLGPEAVNNVTTEAQRDGTIWEYLKEWAGN